MIPMNRSSPELQQLPVPQNERPDDRTVEDVGPQRASGVGGGAMADIDLVFAFIAEKTIHSQQ
jgi:hypothetical protein